jgi:hypothetical protein
MKLLSAIFIFLNTKKCIDEIYGMKEKRLYCEITLTIRWFTNYPIVKRPQRMAFGHPDVL